MDITKGQLEVAIRGLLSQDKYKALSSQIGGWFWAAEAVWAIVGTFKSLAPEALQTMTRTALTVPSQFAALLSDFVADLFQILAIIADEAADIPADAAGFSETPGGQLLLGILSPETFLMEKTGTDSKLLVAIAGVLNPLPTALRFGAATGKNLADAGGRILTSKRRTGTRR